MPLPSDRFEQVDDMFVNPLTGELIEKADQAKVADLPQVCRVLRAIRRRQEMISTYLGDEMERLAVACNAKLTGLIRQEESFMALAERLLRDSGERRLAYPGLGVVRFGTTRESVNTEKWEALSEIEQVNLANNNTGAFRIKTVIHPDKKEILSRLKNDAEKTPGLSAAFSINEKRETFEFKPES
jgi:hypothetical protein